MLAYIGRRALLAIFTVWAISVLSFAIIQLPPGDYVTSYIAQMASMGSVVTDEEAAEPPDPVRPRPAHLRAVLQVGEADRPGQLRHVDGVAAPGHRGDRRAPVADGGGLGGGAHPHLGPGVTDRDLLGGAAILRRRLRRDVHWLHRPGRPQLPARPGLALPRLRVLQRAHRRAVLARDAGRAVEHGQGLGSDEAPADPGGDPGAGRHRPADPHHAREPARRAAQAVRGDGALQGPARDARSS